jgi:predicted transcriptional regulator
MMTVIVIISITLLYLFEHNFNEFFGLMLDRDISFTKVYTYRRFCE